MYVMAIVNVSRAQAALVNLASYLKPTGKLLFRDYGRHDYAQLRFDTGSKLSDNFYARWDGTRAFFFDKTETESLFGAAGLSTVSCDYNVKDFENRKDGNKWKRRMCQGVFALNK